MMPPLRVLQVIRISNETDATTSPERQRAIHREWAQRNGHVVAGVAEDLDVSGGVSPFKRPGLGPWLLKKSGAFDAIVFTDLSRIGRDVGDWSELQKWCKAHGKSLFSCDGSADLSTMDGELMANILMSVHQDYRRRISRKVTESHAKLRADGRYAGSPAPFGYMAADRPGGGRTLAQEPVYAPHLRRIIRDVTNGVSTFEVARRLNAENVMTWGDWRKQMRGANVAERKRWTADVVQQIVRSPACCGFKVVKDRVEDASRPGGYRYLRANRIVYEPDDVTPVMATDDPVVTEAEWRAAVAAMRGRANPGERTAQAESMLQGVAVCASCGTNLYQQRLTKQLKSGPKLYTWYRCQAERKGKECAHPAGITVDLAEQQITDELLHLLGTTEITREEFDPGESYAAEIAAATQRLDELEDDLIAGRYDGDAGRARYHALHTRMTARIDALNALPQRPAETRRVGTGETYAQRWAKCDRLERRAFLIEQGFRVVVAGAGQLCHGSVCQPPGEQPGGSVCGSPEFHELADQIEPDDDLWCCYDDSNRPNRAAHARLVCPDTIWAVEQSDDGNEITMTLQVPAGARLG